MLKNCFNKIFRGVKIFNKDFEIKWLFFKGLFYIIVKIDCYKIRLIIFN